jgi:hypothetical protein
VLFVNTQRMLQLIHGGRADGTLKRRPQVYLRAEAGSLRPWRTVQLEGFKRFGVQRDSVGPLRLLQREVAVLHITRSSRPLCGFR